MNWIAPPSLHKKDIELLQKFRQEIADFNLHELVEEIIWRRGIRTSDELAKIILPDETELLTAYRELFDTAKAAVLLSKAIKSHSKIIISGDYDVDGISATATLFRYIYWELGYKDVVPFIPNRKEHGYGLNKQKIADMVAETLSADPKKSVLLITVDSGIKDEQVVAELKAKYKHSLTVIVTDHHKFPHETSNPLPSADALVHPLHPKSKLVPAEISGAAVAWLLVNAHREYSGHKASINLIEFATLGTVCDLMPLQGINRSITKKGLEKLTTTDIVGLKALKTRAGIPDGTPVGAYHLGFVLGPRINAAGRIGDPLTALKLLSTNDAKTAYHLANELNNLNIARQDLTSSAVLETAAISKSKDNLLVAINPDWEEGIVGLIAGKLQNASGKPTLAITRNSSGDWVGSARSNENVDITTLIDHFAKHLLRFGGHAQAAGFTVKADALETFNKEIVEFANNNIAPELLVGKIGFEAALVPEHMSLSLTDSLQKLEPFGEGNPMPTFLVEVGANTTPQFLGAAGKHVKFSPREFLTPEGIPLEIIWFNHEYSASSHTSNPIKQFMGTLEKSVYNGNMKLQLLTKAYRPKPNAA